MTKEFRRQMIEMIWTAQIGKEIEEFQERCRTEPGFREAFPKEMRSR